jgi:prepilin-type N-terminal cleavage/methylation domain-containing protein
VETGFTLIELMIVILVILILAAILLPQFGVARERARKVACVSNQRNIETAASMWMIDNTPQVYTGGTMNAAGTAVPNMGNLTGTVLYTTPSMFKEPDDPASTGTDGTDYYLSMGAASAPANQQAPSYGHVSCAADKTADPWVASYDGTVGSVNGVNHTRGVAATP